MASSTSEGAPHAVTAALAIWACMLALTLARAALAWTPGMGTWGLNLPRFLAPAVAWVPWALAAIALVPAVGKRLAPAARRLGDVAVTGVVTPAIAAAAAAAWVWLTPDRVRFVGDFLLRQGTAERAIAPASVYPQALPLDVLLHFTLPRALAESLGPDAAARLVGALGAAALALAAIAFARACALRGVAALACVAAVFFGGALALFTGYAKAFGPLVVLTVAAAAAAVRLARDGRGALALGIALALALALHRSALALVPAAAFALVSGARHPDAEPRWRLVAGIALPVIVLVWLGPRIAATLGAVDVAVHLAPPHARAHGLLLAWLLPDRLMDLLNLVALLAPLALALPAAMIAQRGLPRGAVVPALIAVPFALGAFAIHPAQGMARDWDDFAAPATALTLLAAFVTGRALAGATRAEWAGVGIALAVAAPSVQWVGHHADLERGLARVEALAAGPPERAAGERGLMWDFLGIRYAQLGRWDDAGRALSHAAELVPSPRILLQLAMAEEGRGNLVAARDAYRRALERKGDDVLAWMGLAGVALQLGDVAELERIAVALDRLEPGGRAAREVRTALERLRAPGGPHASPAP